MKAGGYPEGTRDELPMAHQPASCPAAVITARRAADAKALRSEFLSSVQSFFGPNLFGTLASVSLFARVTYPLP
jgi:hypothetical protein